MKSPRGSTLLQSGLLALVLLGLGSWAWQRYRQPSVPTYEGKTLDQWLGDLSDPDYTVSEQAADALVRIGADAVPILLEARGGKDIRLHRRAAAVLVRIGAPAAPGLVAALKNGPNPRAETALIRMGSTATAALMDALHENKTGKEAARVLGLIGPRAADAVPALMALLEQRQADAELRHRAAVALGLIGTPRADIVPALVAALKEDKPEVRQGAAEALAWIGPPAQEAIPALVAALKDDKADVSVAACKALARLGADGAVPPLLAALQGNRDKVAEAAGEALWYLAPHVRAIVPALIPLANGRRNPAGTDKETLRVRNLLASLGPTAVPDLTTALRDEDAALRQTAAEVLGTIGPAARQTVPALADALKDKSPPVALAAALALAAIDPTRARPGVPLLIDALDNPFAAEALAEIGPDARAAVPALIAALQPRKDVANNNALRLAARHALACIGAPAVPALSEALKDKSEGVAPLAAEALGSILPPQKEAVSALRQALQRDRAQAGVYALALGELGPLARDAVPDLTALLTDAAVRPHVAVALVRIDPEQAKKVVPILIEDLKGVEENRRKGAVAALAYLGAAAQPAIPELTHCLQDKPLAEAALTALVRIGPAAIPTLAGLLQDPHVEFRRWAASVLASFGPSAREALAPLMGALKDADSEVAASAAHVMEEIGPDARDAVPSLIENLLADSNVVRFTAAIALGHIGASAKEARLPLRECLMDPDERVRYAAALALGRIDPKFIEAVPALRDALHDASVQVRMAAIDSLTRIDRTRIEEVVPILVELSRPPYFVATQFKAVEGLLDLAPKEAAGSVSLLVAELNGENPAFRLNAATLLLRIDPEQTKAVVLALAGALRDRNPGVRGAIAQALGNLGSKAREAVPSLLPLLQDEQAVRKEAAKALRSIDPSQARRLGLR